MSSPSVAMPLPPDVAAFLTLLAEGDPITFQTFAEGSKRAGLAHIHHGQLEEHQAALQRLNDRGAGVFFMVNAGDGKGRTAANVTAVRALFVDLDGVPLGPVEGCGLEPHALVESSPGRYHAYWLVADCVLGRFTGLQKALAARFEGDVTVHDLPRVMRLPGFVHRKGEPFVTRVLRLNQALPYTVQEVIERLQLRPVKAAQTPAQAPAEGARAPLDGPMFAAGGRNQALARLAGKLRRGGLSGEAIEAALLQTNAERCRPPLDDEEVRRVARSIGRYAPGPMSTEPEQPAPAWPEPLLPGAMTVPEIGAALLPDWMGRMARAVAQSTQTPEAMSVLSVLSVLAAVLQRRFEVTPYGDDYREPLSLWTVVVLGSGNRKSAVHKALTSVLADWEKRERDRLKGEIARIYAQREVLNKRIETLKNQAGKEEDAAQRQRMQDEIAKLREQMPAELLAPRLFSGDITSERLQQLLVEQHERAAIVTDEGGIFQIMAGAYSGGISSIDVFLQGHSGSSMRVDRAGRMAHLDRPALTLALALQPGILQDAGKTKRFRDSGLMARLLYAVPRSRLGSRDVRDRRPLSEEVQGEYERRVFALLDDMRLPIGAPLVLPFDADARECWLDLCQRVEVELGEGGRYAHLPDWASKLPGAAARIAGLLALGEHGTGLRSVPLDSVQRAVALCGALIPHAAAAFSLMGAADSETDADMVLAYVRRHRLESVARRDLQKAMEARFRTLDRLLAAIKLLQDWHVLGREERTRGQGRPSVFYTVNPRLFVDNRSLSHERESDPSFTYEEMP